MLLVRHSGAVSSKRGVVLGVTLIVATVAMVGEVVRSLVVDVRKDGTKRAQRDASRDDAGAASAAGAAQPEDGTEAGDAVATTAGGSASPDGGGGAATPAAPSGPSSWDLSALVCGASAEVSRDDSVSQKEMVS